jgi:hypothetical protein
VVEFLESEGSENTVVFCGLRSYRGTEDGKRGSQRARTQSKGTTTASMFSTLAGLDTPDGD